MTRRKTSIITAALAAVAFAGTAQAQFSLKFEGDQPLTVKQAGIAHIRVGALSETPAQQGLFGAQPGAAQTTHELAARLESARKDPTVRAVIVDLNASSFGLGQIAEIRAEMIKLAAADKEVYVTIDALDTRSYALASAATHINVTPTGSVNLIGLHSRRAYLKGLLDMVGVKADFIHIGNFKTAAETITREGPSDAAKVMSDWLYDDLYGAIVSMIADGRSITEDKVRSLIDGGPYLAREALAAGLIDSVEHQQDFIARISGQHGPIRANYAGVNENPFAEMPEDPFGMFLEVVKMLKGKPAQAVRSGNAIAIINVEGAIHSGDQKVGIFGAAKGAFSNTIRRALDQASNDPSIKAVVLRVNSPGGSALASEVIWSSASKLAKNKPLIVSMGDVAASGGYYVSSPARIIFVEPTTITGSIGVVGGKFVTTEGWDRLNVKWHTTQRGAHAGIYSSAAVFTEDERELVRGQMETIYGMSKVDPDGSAAVQATLGALDIIAEEKVATIDLSLTSK